MATILIVDHVATSRNFLVTPLRHQGHRLVEAANGREGLAAVRAHRPDLVITDVLMPVMDGYEFVKQLRLDPATRTIPVVVSASYYGEREATALALSGGVADVLTKPIKSAEVLKIVGRVLSGDSETKMPPDTSPPAIDPEQIRSLTDELAATVNELNVASERLRAVVDIGLTLSSERDSDRRLQIVCAAARHLFGATYATLGIVDLDDGTVAAFRHLGSGHGALDADRRPGLGSPRNGPHRAAAGAWRQSWWRSGWTAAPGAPSAGSGIPRRPHRLTRPCLRLDLSRSERRQELRRG